MPKRTTISGRSQAAELKAIRQHLRLSQPLFARRLGCHHTTLARWETGLSPVPMTALYLARVYAQEKSIPPPIFQPVAREMVLAPGGGCLWQNAACRGNWYTMTAQASPRWQVTTVACEAHMWQAYRAVVARIMRQEARVARQAARRERYRQAGKNAAGKPLKKVHAPEG